MMALGILIGVALYATVDLMKELTDPPAPDPPRTSRERHFLKAIPDGERTEAGQVIAQQFKGEYYSIVINPN